MDFLQSVIFGVVEGLTEFLPISSTAHLVLLAKILKLSQSEFVKSFEICIQLGAILAVVVLYYKKLFLSWQVIKRIIIAFLPTAFLGYLFYKLIKGYLLESYTIIIWSLLIGGFLLIIFELWHKEPAFAKATAGEEDLSKISYFQSFLIGVFQSIAMIPGVSRAAATIIGGLFLGLKRKTIVEFSFLLAVPTMMAATCYDLIKSASVFSFDKFGLLAAGFIISFIVALLAIKFLLNYIKKHNFIWFGVYRIIIGLIFLFL